MGRHTDPAVITRRAAVLTLSASVLLVAAGSAVLVWSGGIGWPGHLPGPTASTPPSSREPEPRRTPPSKTATALPTVTPTTPVAVVTAADARAVAGPRASTQRSTAPTATPTPRRESTGGQGGSGSATVAAQVISLVNAERGRAGCRPLVTSAALQRAAQAHSTDMAENDQLSHDGSDGESFVSRLRAAGYRGGPVGENIAAGPSTATAVMRTWMDSPAHRSNILNCRFTAIGVGRASDSSGSYWTQDFGG